MNKQKKEVKKGILLGIDFGASNIGVALGRNGYTQPIKIVSAKDTTNAIVEISRLAFEKQGYQICIWIALRLK